MFIRSGDFGRASLHPRLISFAPPGRKTIIPSGTQAQVDAHAHWGLKSWADSGEHSGSRQEKCRFRKKFIKRCNTLPPITNNPVGIATTAVSDAGS